jgi:hypothetical protein
MLRPIDAGRAVHRADPADGSRGEVEAVTPSGTIDPGGADRQLLRADCVKEPDTPHERHTCDGPFLTVRKRVRIDDLPGRAHHALSQSRVTAPDGP